MSIATWRRLLALVVFLVPTLVHANYIYNQFFARGANFLDAGLLSSILWRSGWTLQQPLYSGGLAYLSSHFAPALSLLSGLSRWLPGSHVDLFAFYVGSGFGLMAWAVYAGLERPAEPLSYLLARALVGLLFAGNGLALAIATYPHIEIMLVALQLVFFLSLFRGRPVGAALAFALVLTVREDGGFHLASWLGPLGLWAAWRGRRDEARRWLGWALLAGLGGGALWGAGHYFFPGDNAARRIYFGEPAFAHVTWPLLRSRLELVLANRMYFWAPLLFLLGLAWRRRSLPLALGVLSSLPWTVLHLAAYTGFAGSLMTYYAFPYLVAFAWPAVGPPEARGGAGRTVLLVVLLSWLGLVGQTRVGQVFWMDALRGDGLRHRAICLEFTRALSSAGSALEPLLVDSACASIAPRVFGPAQRLDRATSAPRSLLFMRDFMHAPQVRVWLGSLPEPGYWRVGDSPMLLALAGGALPPVPLRAYLRPYHAAGAYFELLRGRDTPTGYVLAPGSDVACRSELRGLAPGRYRLRIQGQELQALELQARGGPTGALLAQKSTPSGLVFDLPAGIDTVRIEGWARAAGVEMGRVQLEVSPSI